MAQVAIAPEFRSGGVLAGLLGPLLAQAREQGAVISALFPTTAVPYRRLGWERTGACGGRRSRRRRRPPNGGRTA